MSLICDAAAVSMSPPFCRRSQLRRRKLNLLGIRAWSQHSDCWNITAKATTAVMTVLSLCDVSIAWHGVSGGREQMAPGL